MKTTRLTIRTTNITTTSPKQHPNDIWDCEHLNNHTQQHKGKSAENKEIATNDKEMDTYDSRTRNNNLRDKRWRRQNTNSNKITTNKRWGKQQ